MQRSPETVFLNGSVLTADPKDRICEAVAGRRLLDRGIPIAFHSDLPVVPCNPLPAIHSAVTRKTESGQAIGPNQKISIREAIRAYTLGGPMPASKKTGKDRLRWGNWQT
jgi:hypothetical protein